MHDLRLNETTGVTETLATEKIMDACRANPARHGRQSLPGGHSVVFKARESDSLYLALLFNAAGDWVADALVDEMDV